MEKAQSLVALDREICNYHLRNNYSKKDDLFCYQPDRKQISEFYSSMAEHFYQAHLRSPLLSPRRPQPHKTRAHLQHALRDPTLACLPRPIPQANLIDPGPSHAPMNPVPMFSEVQSSKKQKYLIAREVRQLLGHDIKQMQQEKEEIAFRRRFPTRKSRSRPQQPQEPNTEVLIKEFNRLLIKYKNNALNLETPLNLLEKENVPCFTPQATVDQQFKILNLFKKLYLETKSEDINQHLINYLLKFHIQDKFTKKITSTHASTNNRSHNYSSNHIEPQQPMPHSQQPLKISRTTSQASIRTNVKDSKNKPPKCSQFKNEKTSSIKKRTLNAKDAFKMRSLTTHNLKLKL